MAFDVTAEYPPPYNTLVTDWLEISAAAPVNCDGNAQQQTITVYIHGDAPPGTVPIVVTGTGPGNNSCQTTGNVTVHRNYPRVEVLYKAFIGCDVIPLTLSGIPVYFFKGDNRGFGYSLGPSRMYESFTGSLDPVYPNGDVGLTTGLFGATQRFDNEGNNDVNVCLGGPVCPSYCQYCKSPTATAECTLVAVSGSGGNLLSVLFQPRPNLSTLQMQMDLVGHNPCLLAAPAIDVHMVLQLQQICIGNALGPLEYRLVSGFHDGFPWHEMYINQIPVYLFDPCAIGTPDPNHLFGSGDIDMLNSSQYPGLGQWRPVPGQ